MSLRRVFKLNSGYDIPALGFGSWLSKPPDVGAAVERALRLGYRHLDAASLYANEKEVGCGWRRSGVPRDQIFITGKLWNTHHHPAHVEEALDRSLSDLQTDYLDLYLIHWPVSFAYSNTALSPTDPVSKRVQLADIPIADTWAALETLVAKTGKIRSIGVSNFTRNAIESLVRSATIPPAVNEVEAHPYLQQPGLLGYLQEKNILLIAYSPRGNPFYSGPRVVDDPTVQQVAKNLSKDPFPLLLSWGIQRGTAVLAKSVTPAHIEANFHDFVIPDAEFDALNSLERNRRYNFPASWGVDIFQELGDEEADRRAEEVAAKQRA